MTSEQIKKAANKYAAKLSGLTSEPRRYPSDQKISSHQGMYQHCYWMCTEIVILVNEKQFETALRRLEFVRGVLWARGVYTLDDFKEDNR